MVKILGSIDYVMRVLHNCGASSKSCGVPSDSHWTLSGKAGGLVSLPWLALTKNVLFEISPGRLIPMIRYAC
jgi:hypothetical protein